MSEDDMKRLSKDTDGLLTYEYIANHIGDENLDISRLTDNMIKVDLTGQFVVSAARYLAAIDPHGFSGAIDRLVKAAIDKDREHRYIPDLLPSLWGVDYETRAEELIRTDDNFRRIHKRVFASGKI